MEHSISASTPPSCRASSIIALHRQSSAPLQHLSTVGRSGQLHDIGSPASRKLRMVFLGTCLGKLCFGAFLPQQGVVFLCATETCSMVAQVASQGNSSLTAQTPCIIFQCREPGQHVQAWTQDPHCSSMEAGAPSAQFGFYAMELTCRSE